MKVSKQIKDIFRNTPYAKEVGWGKKGKRVREIKGAHFNKEGTAFKGKCLFDDKIEQVIRERSMKLNTIVTIFVKPKPRLLPEALWRWLLEKLVVIQLVDKWL